LNGHEFLCLFSRRTHPVLEKNFFKKYVAFAGRDGRRGKKKDLKVMITDRGVRKSPHDAGYNPTTWKGDMSSPTMRKEKGNNFSEE